MSTTPAEPVGTGTVSVSAHRTDRDGVGWRVARVVLWTLVIGWVVFTGLRLTGFAPVWPVVAALAYTPWIAAAAIVPVGLAAVLWAWRLLAVVAACALMLAVLVVPRALPAAPPAADGPSLRVLTVNLYGGEGDAPFVAELVRWHQVDILAVQELTLSGADALAAAGIDDLLPHQELRAGSSVEGSGIYARYPLAGAPALEFDSRFAMPAVTLRVPGAGLVEVMAVHPTPPVASHVGTWRRELRELPPATPDGAVRVLAGDFNATLDHAPLRELIATGYRDAAASTGAGLTGTWQMNTGVGSLIPPVPLDRVLVDARAAVNEVTVHDVLGSDHRAVFADLTLPAG